MALEEGVVWGPEKLPLLLLGGGGGVLIIQQKPKPKEPRNTANVITCNSKHHNDNKEEQL